MGKLSFHTLGIRLNYGLQRCLQLKPSDFLAGLREGHGNDLTLYFDSVGSAPNLSP